MTDSEQEPPGDPGTVSWLPWLAWGWVALLLLAAVAELTDWHDLRLALDFQRHFR